MASDLNTVSGRLRAPLRIEMPQKVKAMTCEEKKHLIGITNRLSILGVETPTPQRKGLRSSALRPKKKEPAKLTGPIAVETWVPEEELELWEIRGFAER